MMDSNSKTSKPGSSKSIHSPKGKKPRNKSPKKTGKLCDSRQKTMLDMFKKQGPSTPLESKAQDKREFFPKTEVSCIIGDESGSTLTSNNNTNSGDKNPALYTTKDAARPIGYQETAGGKADRLSLSRKLSRKRQNSKEIPSGISLGAEPGHQGTDTPSHPRPIDKIKHISHKKQKIEDKTVSLEENDFHDPAKLTKIATIQQETSITRLADNSVDIMNIDDVSEVLLTELSDINSMELDGPSTSQTSDVSLGKSELVTRKDSVAGGVESETPETITYRVPYYLENFLLVLNSVMEDDFYADLFNTDDLNTIANFRSLSEDAQKLYVRLFSRKFRWVSQSKIVYPKIAEDLSDILKELVESSLVLDESGMTELDVILKALPAPDVKSLAKTLKLNPSAVREELIEAILSHSKKQNINDFFGKRTGGTASMIQRKAKALLGPCYKLDKDQRYVFIRVIMLFALHKTQGDEDENAGGQQLLFQMLTSNIGSVKYLDYKIRRETKVFQDREALLRLGRALQSEADMYEATESKDYDTGLAIYNSIKSTVSELLADSYIVSHDQSLPEFLRSFTALSAYTRVLTMGVEILQSKKLFKEAVRQLKELLELKVYHPNYRGRWYERLALNLDFHLKKPAEALDVIQKALDDPCVRTGRRLALWQRAEKICHSPSCKKLKPRWHEFAQDPMSYVQEAPKTVIQCQRMSSMVPGQAGAWLLRSEGAQGGDHPEEATYIHRVEDVVLAHYQDNGYPQGIHGEGGTFKTLFGLLLWDEIFTEGIPDVFYTPYQLQPLDLGTDQFYLSRKSAIDAKLNLIKSSTADKLEEMVGEVWEEHKDTLSAVVNWERFDGAEHVQGLIRCLGGKALSGILERMAVNMRHTTGGVPDLVVWNPDTGQVKVSEVKGPNDRLSTKQILWIDYLLKLGVDTEVCHVEAVGTKRIVRS